jgi:hypothetical protein
MVIIEARCALCTSKSILLLNKSGEKQLQKTRKYDSELCGNRLYCANSAVSTRIIIVLAVIIRFLR